LSGITYDATKDEFDWWFGSDGDCPYCHDILVDGSYCGDCGVEWANVYDGREFLRECAYLYGSKDPEEIEEELRLNPQMAHSYDHFRRCIENERKEIEKAMESPAKA
jgi:hypothetical protein